MRNMTARRMTTRATIITCQSSQWTRGSRWRSDTWHIVPVQGFHWHSRLERPPRLKWPFLLLLSHLGDIMSRHRFSASLTRRHTEPWILHWPPLGLMNLTNQSNRPRCCSVVKGYNSADLISCLLSYLDPLTGTYPIGPTPVPATMGNHEVHTNQTPKFDRQCWLLGCHCK